LKVDLALLFIPIAEEVSFAILAASPLAAVIVVVAGRTFRRAAALVVVAVAVATTAGGILGARLPIAKAAAFSRIAVPILASAVVLFLFLFLPLVALAVIGAALRVLAAGVTRETAPLNEHIVFSGEAKVSPGQRDEGDSRSRHVLQRGPAIAQSGYQSCPVVEPAFVHAGLLSSLFQTYRAN
jgi:hypothetical protein